MITVRKISDQLGGYSSINFVGAGTLKTYFEPENFESSVSQDLIGIGWGITEVRFINAVDLSDRTQWLRLLSPFTAAVPTWNYFISITVNALDGDNPERIRNGLANYLTYFFKDLQLKNASQSGHIPNSNAINAIGE